MRSHRDGPVVFGKSRPGGVLLRAHPTAAMLTNQSGCAPAGRMGVHTWAAFGGACWMGAAMTPATMRAGSSMAPLSRHSWRRMIAARGIRDSRHDCPKPVQDGSAVNALVAPSARID